MVIGIVLVALAIWVAVRAVRQRERPWVQASVIGVVGIVVGFLGGVWFMSTNGAAVASMVMALGCVAAIAGYVYALAEH
jgi:uncharacterized protein YqgC (DUF456 family)